MDKADLVIVGAGPAGLAASAVASDLKLDAQLIDDQRSAGGQIYRGSEQAGELVKNVTGVRWAYETTVWNMSAQAELDVTGPDGTGRIKAQQIILATGALERPMPFPGWTLPGVMTAGALQIAMKTSGLVPADGVVLAGSGPLLYLLANQLHDAGANIEALVDTTPVSNWSLAITELGGLLLSGGMLVEGLTLLAGLRKRKIRHIKGVTSLKADGDSCVQRVSFNRHGRIHTIDCTALAVHMGVVPNVQLTRLIGLEHRWQENQRCWDPIAQIDGSTEVPWLKLAGDGAGILGAASAAIQGELAAVTAARDLLAIDKLTASTRIRDLEKRYRRSIRARPFINARYRPSDEFLVPEDETIVCRCEEVSAGDIRGYVDLGCRGPNQTKSFGRPGMGPCQGRLCGLTVSEIIADKLAIAPEEVGYYRIRPPIKPLTLSELASLRTPQR